MRDSQGSVASSAAGFAALLKRHQIRQDKRLGQHFLFDPAWLEKVVSAAELRGDEIVLEVGAGVGSLTQRLARAARRVVAVEIDRRLIPALKETLAGEQNVTILHGDFLSLDLDEVSGESPYCVVANIPYQITSMLIRYLLEAPRPPERTVMTMQREVAERVVAGEGEMSLLALGVQLYGVPRIVDRIPAGAFYPPPEVESAILRIDLFETPRLAPDVIGEVFEVARMGFSQRRKKLRNALASGLGVPAHRVDAWLQEAGLSPALRAQQLSLGDWERLARVTAMKRREGEAIRRSGMAEGPGE